MSESIANLKHKTSSAADLLAVVRTMKAMTASNMNQYERAVSALDDYYRTVQLGLVTCFQQINFSANAHKDFLSAQNAPQKTGVLVFGSDQGLVGQFNDSLAEFVLTDLADREREQTIWIVGERLQASLAQTDLTLETPFALPRTVNSITPLVGEILLAMETFRAEGKINAVLIYHNQPDPTHNKSGALYVPVKHRMLPLDAQWLHHLIEIPWPTSNLPEVVNAAAYNQHKNNYQRETLLALIHEYLFVSLYRACAEFMASENASRLAAMQRAEKNIDELLLKMNSRYHSLRQSGIDEELFDVISGFNALSG